MASRALAHLLQSSLGSFLGRRATSLHVDTDDQTEKILDHFIDSSIAHGIATFFAIVAFGLSMRLIFKHLQHYNRPLLQRQVVRIILIVPVYAVCSALSLNFEHEAVYINTIRDIYEAYCIHCFLVLMLDFPGGEAAVVEGIKEKGLLKHPFPCGLCCSKIQLGAEFIVSMKRTTMQFVIIKPIMALLAIIFMLSGVFNTDAAQYFILVVYNLSYTTALYGLFLFYLGTKSLLVGFSPVSKFSAVKVIVFATYYQSLIVVALPGMDELGSSERWNDFIICIEMAMFAIMHEYCFSYTEFQPGGVCVSDLAAQGFEEPVNLREDTSWEAVRMRIGDVFSIDDTLDDIKRIFSSHASDHIQLGVEGGILSHGTVQRIEEEKSVSNEFADLGPDGALGAGKPAPPPLTRVRVVDENALNTDQESLFASAAGARVLVKTAEGEMRLARMGANGVEEVEGSRGRINPTGGLIQQPSGGGGDDDPYSFIAASADGVTDATKVTVNSKEELMAAARREAEAKSRGATSEKEWVESAALGAAKGVDAAGKAHVGHRSRAGSNDVTAKTAVRAAPDAVASSAAAAQELLARLKMGVTGGAKKARAAINSSTKGAAAVVQTATKSVVGAANVVASKVDVLTGAAAAKEAVAHAAAAAEAAAQAEFAQFTSTAATAPAPVPVPVKPHAHHPPSAPPAKIDATRVTVAAPQRLSGAATGADSWSDAAFEATSTIAGAPAASATSWDAEAFSEPAVGDAPSAAFEFEPDAAAVGASGDFEFAGVTSEQPTQQTEAVLAANDTVSVAAREPPADSEATPSDASAPEPVHVAAPEPAADEAAWDGGEAPADDAAWSAPDDAWK